MKIGENSLHYLVDTAKGVDAQLRDLDTFVPWFFDRYKIITNSDIIARCLSPKEIELIPAIYTPELEIKNRKTEKTIGWKFASDILTTKINDITFHVYRTNDYL